MTAVQRDGLDALMRLVVDGESKASSTGRIGWMDREIYVAALRLLDAEADRLGAGIKAAIILRLIAGDTGQTYTPTEVSVMVSSVVDEQLARFTVDKVAS